MLDLIIMPLAFAAGLTYLTWVAYLAVMSLARARAAGTLSKTGMVLGAPLLLVGYTLDVALNVTVISVVLWELPREATVTDRLRRHKKGSTGWRLTVVEWVEPLLDPHDHRGDHI